MAECSASATPSSTAPPADRAQRTDRRHRRNPFRARLLARRRPMAECSRFGDAQVPRLHRRTARSAHRSSASPQPLPGTATGSSHPMAESSRSATRRFHGSTQWARAQRTDRRHRRNPFRSRLLARGRRRRSVHVRRRQVPRLGSGLAALGTGAGDRVGATGYGYWLATADGHHARLRSRTRVRDPVPVGRRVEPADRHQLGRHDRGVTERRLPGSRRRRARSASRRSWYRDRSRRPPLPRRPHPPPLRPRPAAAFRPRPHPASCR